MSYERKRWHTHVFTSTYTADVSGVCSAMYELGGMTILHDPSGCNSTYTTHDEPRWYDSKSLMFVSGLDEMTAVMGDDSVLIRDAVRAAADLKPRFITLCGASIPHIISFDFKGVARLIEREKSSRRSSKISQNFSILPFEDSAISGRLRVTTPWLNRP